jgi:hypothetical protein
MGDIDLALILTTLVTGTVVTIITRKAIRRVKGTTDLPQLSSKKSALT